MVGVLWAAAIPCGLAGTITTVHGLYLIRFFVGIVSPNFFFPSQSLIDATQAGAAFVPCQVWCTGFYDKEVVGTANAFAAGWGNAGG